MSVSFLNYIDFVMIALYQSATGHILSLGGQLPNGTYPQQTYVNLFLFLTCASAVSLLLLLVVPETGKPPEKLP